jgi:hypothetical protein
MTELCWGLLGPEKLESKRRTRTLGLAPTVRKFNDLAVPGMGGVWYGKQLFLATLGVAVADHLSDCGKGISKIPTTNAIEALACWIGLKENGWKSDPRLRGALKMQTKREPDLLFSKMRRPNFYVTQPMRMATVQALPALELVESKGERFNSFACNTNGLTFIEYACSSSRPYNTTVLAYLTAWAKGEKSGVTTHALSKVLNPMEALAQSACEFLRERIVQKDGEQGARRRAALAWVERLRTAPQNDFDWNARPAELEGPHWDDLHAGTLFFEVRDAAIDLLNHVETMIATRGEGRMSLSEPLDGSIREHIAAVRDLANQFLAKNCDHSPDRQASAFCNECLLQEDKKVLENIVKRDGRVLRLRDNLIVPGDASQRLEEGSADPELEKNEDNSEEPKKVIPLPEGISGRLRNLFLLNADLHGEMMKWIDAAQSSGGDDES